MRKRLRLAGGHVATDAELVCDRCARRFSYRLEADVAEDVSVEPGPDDAAFVVPVGDGVALDVDALVREILIASLPMVSRCDPDCKGLCAGCGADLRVEACRCGPDGGRESADPRLRALAGWRPDRGGAERR